MSRRANQAVRRCLAERLRLLRKERGLSQERLGELAGLSGKFIGEVERAEKSISVDSLASLTKALGVTIHDLLPRASTVNREAERIYALALSTSRPALRKAYAVLRAFLSEDGEAMKMKPTASSGQPRGTTGHKDALSKEQRQEIATRATQARWARAKKVKTTKKGW